MMKSFLVTNNHCNLIAKAEAVVTDASRTHGSLYEQEVPLLAIHPAAPAEAYQYSKDIAAVLFETI